MKYKISELAKLAGISTRTLRYYDEIGILKPVREADSNYRYYNDDDIDKLQQILLLTSIGMPLDQVKQHIDSISTEERIILLDNHLILMNQKQKQIQMLIKTIQKTIKSLKGEIHMNNQEKFEGLKEKLIIENDNLYKTEVIKNWGIDAYEKSRKQFKNMTNSEFDYFNELQAQIIDILLKIKDTNDEKLRETVALLHKEWISMAWGFYNKDAHLNVVDMYVLDDRFKSYYDTHGKGLAKILRDSVHKYL